MGFSTVRRVTDRLREELEERRRAQQIKDQRTLFRQWMKLGTSPSEEFLPSPGEMNPLGMAYERERIADTSLRPGPWYQRIADRAAEAAPEPTAQRGLAEGFAPTDLLAQQEAAFGGMTPVEAGGQAAQQFFEQVPEEQLPMLGALAGGLEERGMMPQDFAAAAQAPPEAPLGQAFGLGFGAPGTMGPEATQALGLGGLMPDEEEQLQQAFLAGQAGAEAQGLVPEPAPGLVPGLMEQAQREVEFFRPYTEPIGRVLGETVSESLTAGRPSISPLLREAGVPQVQPPGSELAGQIGGVVAPELLVPSNVAMELAFAPSLLARGPKVAAGIARTARRAPVEEIAEQAVRQAPVEQVARRAEEALPVAREAPVGPRAAAAAEPPQVVPAAQAPPARAEVPSLGGGAPLTKAEVAARGAPPAPPEPPGIVRGIRDAISRSGPGREGREAGRIASGAINLGNLEVKNWGNDTLDLARRAKVKIVPGGGIEQQSDETIEMFERIWGGVDPASGRTARGIISSFPEHQRPLAQALYDRLDEITQRLIRVDPDFEPHLLEEYFPHLFKTAKRPGGVARRGLVTRPGFGQRRKLEGTLGDILNDRPDLDLVSWDPIDFVKRHEIATNHYLAQVEVIQMLKGSGALQTTKKAPAFWRSPDLPGFGIRQKLQHWRADPAVARALENLFGNKSAFDSNGMLKPIKGLRGVLFRIKVAGGLFQHIDFSQRAIFRGFVEGLRAMSPVRRAGKGIPIGAGFKVTTPGLPRGMVRSMFSPFRATARSAIPALDRKISKLTLANPDLKGGYANGLGAGADPSIGEGAIRGLGGIVPQTVAGKQIPGARWLQEVVEFITGGAYETFHRDMLEQGYLVTLEKHVRAGIPREEAYRLAAEETNVVFSSVPNWQSAVMNPTTKDIIRIGTFSPGELEGLVRMPFQSPATFTGIIGGTVIAAQMLNKLFTGDWLKPEQLLPYELDPDELKRFTDDPRTILSLGAPGIDYRTKFLRPELPWKGPDGRPLYLDLLGQADTVFRIALDPIFAIQTRLGQLPRAALDLEQIRRGEAPAFGERVESPRDLLKAGAQQVSPIALSGLAGTEVGRIGLLGAGVQATGLNISAERVSTMRGDIIRTEHKAGNLIGEYDEIPPATLIPTDRKFLEEKYPELFVEPGEEYTEDVLAGVGEREMGAIRSRDLDQAREDRDARLDALKDEARDADAAEKDTRRRLEELGKNALSGYRERTSPIFDELFKEDREAASRFERLSQRYRELDDKHARRFTAAEPDEIWDAYQAEFDAAFNEEEQEILRREFGVNDHEWEATRSEMTRSLRDYYDIEERTDRLTDNARKELRRQNPEIDAALWALGRTSCLESGAGRDFRTHQTAALDAFNQLYGTRPDAGDAERCGAGGRSYERSYSR